MEKVEVGPSQEKKGALAALSKESIAHPDHNEDAFFVDEQKKVFAVFDGVGGHGRGEVASHLAAIFVEKKIKELKDTTPEEVGQMLSKILIEADGIVRYAGGQKLDHISRALDTEEDRAALEALFRGAESAVAIQGANAIPVGERTPGSTASVVKIIETPTGPIAVVANVGDTRVGIRRQGSGAFEEVTLDDAGYTDPDHAHALALQKKFSELSSEEDKQSLTSQERFYFDHRNIIRQGLGFGSPERDENDHVTTKSIIPNVYIVPLKSGDMILLSSDGVHDNLTDTEIAEALASGGSDTKAQRLIEQAYARSATRRTEDRHARAKEDDITAIVYEVPSATESHDSVEHQVISGSHTLEGRDSRELILKEAFQRADTFEKLYTAIQVAGGVQVYDRVKETNELWDAERLIAKIEGIRAGRDTDDDLIHPGLRRAIKRIAEIEKLRATLTPSGIESTGEVHSVRPEIEAFLAEVAGSAGIENSYSGPDLAAVLRRVFYDSEPMPYLTPNIKRKVKSLLNRLDVEEEGG